MTPYRIVLADDHKMFRLGVRKIIDAADDLEVVAEVDDGLQLLNLLKTTDIQMIILDISMPNLRGIETTREVKIIRPSVKILILTMHKNKEYMYHCLSAGAEGYLLKEDTDAELFSAIKTIRQGGIYISPILSLSFADELAKICTGMHPAPIERLTVREREVLTLIAEGKTRREIADILYISVHTVGHHRANIMKKINVKKTAELVKYAIKQGYVWEQP